MDEQAIGNDLAIRWATGGEAFIPLETLRRRCPCAGCRGETDILGNLYKGPEAPLTPEAFRLVRLMPVGGYAVQPVWGDGHASGIFSYEYLRKLASS